MTQLEMTPPTAAVRDAIHELIDAVRPEMDALAAEMTERIHSEIDVLSDALREETRLSCRSNIGLIAEMLAEDLEAPSAVAPAEAVHYAREFARADLPIEELMRAYRIGHRVWWSTLLERLQLSGGAPDAIAEASLYCSQWLFAYVDAVTLQITKTFMHERDRWVRSAAALRTEEVRAILNGTQADELRASKRLRYDLRRQHIGLLIFTDAVDGEGTMSLFERIAQDCARVLGGTDVLSVPIGQLTLAAWVGFADRAPDPAALGPVRTIEALEAGVHLAVGEPAPGIEGFRRTHADALVARRVDRLRDRRPGSVTRYVDAALLGLLAQDHAEALRFAMAELGPLAESTDAARRIAATLRVFLEEGSSHVRAARRLGVHENTIAYRVKRAEALLGRPLDDRALELQAALLLAETLRDD